MAQHRASKPTLSVIVPALNEESHIADAVREVTTAIGDHFSDYELLLFNDGSSDRTGDIMDSLARENPKIRVTHHKTPRNLGGVYKEGLKQARFDYVIMVPGDNENPGSALIEPFRAVGSADIVLPYVERGKRSAVRNAVSSLYVSMMNTVFNLDLRYYNGTVIHKTSLVRSIDINTDSFAYQTEALVKLLRAGHSFVEVRVELPGKRDGQSKAFRPKNVLGVLSSVAALAADVYLLNPRPSARQST